MPTARALAFEAEQFRRIAFQQNSRRYIVQSYRRHFTLFTTLLFALCTFLIVVAQANAAAATYRWDTTNVLPVNGVPTISAGGSDYALAADLTSIQIQGHGTFGGGAAPTGGGFWTITNAAGTSTTKGTFTVTGLVQFVPANGSEPPTFADTIGNKADARSGLAVLRISYSDGSSGTLTVSCHLPVKSSGLIFEGITATKSFVDFHQRVPPVPGVNANRNIFHVLP
jgi:hypothetical protein